VSTFVKYLDEVEILESWTGAWQVVDLEPYGVDPSAKAVTLRIIGSSAPGTSYASVADINSTTPGVIYCRKNKYCCAIAGLAGGSTINLRMVTPSAPRVFITGEVQGDDVVIYDENKAINLVEADFGVWQDRQPTPQGADSLSDISAVIVLCWQWDDGSTGIRHPDSVNGPSTATYWGGYHWLVVGVDNDGYYQTYTTGKAGSDAEDAYFFEIGYILRTSKVVPLIDWGAPQFIIHDNTWRALDVSASVPANTVLVGLRMRNAFPTVAKRGFCRSIGSANSPGLLLSGYGGISSQMPALNANREFEYKVNHTFIAIYLVWYERETEVQPAPSPFNDVAVIDGLRVDELVGATLREEERVMAQLNAPANVGADLNDDCGPTARLRAEEQVSYSGLRTKAAIEIRQLRSDEIVSATLRS